MSKAEELKQDMPEFLYESEGHIKIGWHGDSIVTDEWNKFLDKYANEVIREAFEAGLIKAKREVYRESFQVRADYLFNEWITEQEEKKWTDQKN